jgi:hypothetical protein
VPTGLWALDTGTCLAVIVMCCLCAVLAHMRTHVEKDDSGVEVLT